jgi:AcrR family transcriptional regulator
MKQRAANVKHKRSYDASRRQEQAGRNRARTIDVAERLFLRDGYRVTTVAAIAVEAGVSADTIYKSFGGKAGLVRAIRARALEGEGAAPAEQRSDDLQAREQDPRKIIRAWGALSAEIAPRAAPILLLLRDAAASDLEVRALLEEMDADRLRRMTENARRLRDAGHLRAGITLTRAADMLWTYSSPELYELVVLRRGWSPERYGRFIAEAMISVLL